MRHVGLHSRVSGALGLILYVIGTVVAPITHIVAEHGHTSIREVAQRIDPNRFRDPATGHVDLQRLAEALGLNAGAHDESKPHSHAPGEAPSHGPLDHGRGSLQHFGVALLTTGAIAFIPARLASRPLPQSCGEAIEVPGTHPFLAVQRAQAPPV